MKWGIFSVLQLLYGHFSGPPNVVQLKYAILLSFSNIKRHRLLIKNKQNPQIIEYDSIPVSQVPRVALC